ncbi:uncharacterized protein BDZ99DRAFT_569590 [Mytilinidion resinicola]|uniref:F-box domain-containing protein n=1 Tax=Mytilinidion resinicola TaxID=574789 RepID=A0A6A6YRM2_9PEZI|nr:uncharacterized protein BDZ99DRAFT_569590 [Mytilinidion resinicola]KAF2811586.1 hypothetical protein BDZ99DRAFT_569590 [Mytilinidion resinicola]
MESTHPAVHTQERRPPSLPNEMLMEIFSHVRQSHPHHKLKALRHLALASHAFHNLVTPILYSEFSDREFTPLQGDECEIIDYKSDDGNSDSDETNGLHTNDSYSGEGTREKIHLFLRIKLANPSLTKHLKFATLRLSTKAVSNPLGYDDTEWVLRKIRGLPLPFDRRFWAVRETFKDKNAVAALVLTYATPILTKVRELSFRQTELRLPTEAGPGFRLPSLIEYSGCDIVPKIAGSPWPPVNPSNLTSISILEAPIHLESLEMLLAWCAKLNLFSYAFNNSYSDMRQNEKPIKIINALRKHSSKSLEKLRIHHNHRPTFTSHLVSPIYEQSSLVIFGKLSSLYIDAPILFGTPPADL